MFSASFILKCQSLKVNWFQLHVLKFSPFFIIKAYLEKWSITVSPSGLHFDSNAWTVKQLTCMTEGNFVMLLIQKRVSSSALCLCQASINLVDVSALIRDRILEMAYLMQFWRDCQVTPKILVYKLLSMRGGHWEQRKLLYFKLMWDQRHSGRGWLAGQFNQEFFCSYCI